MDLIVDHYSNFNDFHAILNSEKMSQCFLSNGDIIELYNQNMRFLAAVYGSETCSSDKILLSRTLCINSNLFIGSNVSIRPYKNCHSADCVVFAPIEDSISNITGPFDKILNKILKNLQGIPILKNYIVPVYTLNRVVEFRAVILSPSNAVVINDTKVVACKNAPIPRNPESNEEDSEEESLFNDFCFDDIGGFFAKEDSMIRLSLTSKESNVFFITAPSGCGKSLLCEIIKNETDMYFSQIKGYQTLAVSTNLAIKQLENITKETIQNSPSVLFIDDFDQIAQEMVFLVDQDDDQNDQKKLEQKDYTLAKCLFDQLNILKGSPNVVVFCAMKSDSFPASFREQTIRVDVPLPDYEQRLSILEALTRKMSFKSNSERMKTLKFIAKNAKGKTGADLLQIVEECPIDELAQYPNNTNSLSFGDFSTKLSINLPNNSIYKNQQNEDFAKEETEDGNKNDPNENFVEDSDMVEEDDLKKEEEETQPKRPKKGRNNRNARSRNRERNNRNRRRNKGRSKRGRKIDEYSEEDFYDDYYEEEDFYDEPEKIRKTSSRKSRRPQPSRRSRNKKYQRRRRQEYEYEYDDDYYYSDDEVEERRSGRRNRKEREGETRDKKYETAAKAKKIKEIESAENDYEEEENNEEIEKMDQQNEEEETQETNDAAVVRNKQKDARNKNKDNEKSRGKIQETNNEDDEEEEDENEENKQQIENKRKAEEEDSNDVKVKKTKKRSKEEKAEPNTENNVDQKNDGQNIDKNPEEAKDKKKDEKKDKKKKGKEVKLDKNKPLPFGKKKNPLTADSDSDEEEDDEDDNKPNENKFSNLKPKNLPFGRKTTTTQNNSDSYSDEDNENATKKATQNSKPQKIEKNSPFARKKESNNSEYSEDDEPEKTSKKAAQKAKQSKQPQTNENRKSEKNSPFARKKESNSEYSEEDEPEKTGKKASQKTKQSKQSGENRKSEKNSPFAKKKESNNSEYSEEDEPEKTSKKASQKSKQPKQSVDNRKSDKKSLISHDEEESQKDEKKQPKSGETKEKLKKGSPFQKKKDGDETTKAETESKKESQTIIQKPPTKPLMKPTAESSASSDSDDLQLHKSRTPAASKPDQSKKKKSASAFPDPFSDKKAAATNLPQRKVDNKPRVAAGTGVDPFAAVPKKEKLNLDLLPKKSKESSDEEGENDVSIGVEIDDTKEAGKKPSNPFARKGGKNTESDSYSDDGGEKKKKAKQPKQNDEIKQKKKKKNEVKIDQDDKSADEEPQKGQTKDKKTKQEKQQQQQQGGLKKPTSTFGIHVVSIKKPAKKLNIAFSDSESNVDNKDDVSPQESSSSEDVPFGGRLPGH